ncbi:unnamed protein product [Coregonus sp. 'balchen']|nr:unnamed protein product [Coregonus sp. 'balchen']
MMRKYRKQAGRRGGEQGGRREGPKQSEERREERRMRKRKRRGMKRDIDVGMMPWPSPCPPSLVWLKIEVMKMMGPFLSGLPMDDIQTIPNDQLCQFFHSPQFPSSFRGVGGLPPLQGRKILQKIRECSQKREDLVQNLDRCPIGRAFALVQPASERPALKPEPIKPSEEKAEKVEIIKVYLEDRRQEQQRHQQSLKMLSEEVSQIQEVRYCLKTLREQMATKNKGQHNFPASGYRVSAPSNQNSSSSSKGGAKDDGQEGEEEAERAKMRDVSKRLYAQLQEAEKKHQEERDRLQAEGVDLRQRLGEQREKLEEVKEGSERKDQRIEELQRLLGDDMLKSQQRKVRHMIEQNREMHDQMDYFLGGERSNSHLSSDRNAHIVYSKPLKPTNSSNKPLPFIKIIETKS